MQKPHPNAPEEEWDVYIKHVYEAMPECRKWVHYFSPMNNKCKCGEAILKMMPEGS